MTPEIPPAGLSLDEARTWLRARVEGGEHCPCCGQLAKVYRRTINAGMARSLVVMHKASAPGDWVNVPEVVGAASREEGKLAYWGLLEESPGRRPDRGRAGWWRLTDRGRLFALGDLAVPRYARVYDGRCLGLYGTPIRIGDALGTRFDYAELMSA